MKVESTIVEASTKAFPFAKLAVSRRAFDIIDIPMYACRNETFFIGDVVRSYQCGFDNILPYKHSYIEGVVIGVSDKILGEKYLVVKWRFQKVFGVIYAPYKLPHNGLDTFPISVSSPYLFRVGVLELPFC